MSSVRIKVLLIIVDMGNGSCKFEKFRGIGYSCFVCACCCWLNTNFDDVGKQNSNGRIEENKIWVEFIVVYMSVRLLLWSVAGRDEYDVTLWLTGNE